MHLCVILDLPWGFVPEFIENGFFFLSTAYNTYMLTRIGDRKTQACKQFGFLDKAETANEYKEIFCLKRIKIMYTR